MDGRNSIGRRISLLNESEAPSLYTNSSSNPSNSHSSRSSSSSSSSSDRSGSSNRLPSLPRSLHSHSRTSSYASTPVLSPQTPSLTRSDSSDSRIMQIPSPITPDFAFDPSLIQTQQFPSPQFGQKQSFFAPLPKDAQSMPYPAVLQQQQQQQQPNFAFPAPQAGAAVQPQGYLPASAPMTSATASASVSAPEKEQVAKSGSTGKPQSKKNQYPCPMAKQFNCNDYFTTSGHAARHAKKHTGRKDALCPECNKAFTRKDNMEQHRRTHQNGRSSAKDGVESSSSSSARKSKSQQHKRPKPASLQPSAITPIDPMLPTSPGSSINFSDAANLSQVSMQGLPSFASQYIDPIPYRYDALPTGFTTGLDTLAIVATGEDRKRKLDE